MLAQFECIGRIGFVRVDARKTVPIIYFSLATQRAGKYRKPITDWNNNFTLKRNVTKKTAEEFKMGTLVWVRGNIISYSKKGVQYNRFLVHRYRILGRPDRELIDKHLDRYSDLPPEEYYDTFEEQTDSLNEQMNPFRSNAEENPWEENL